MTQTLETLAERLTQLEKSVSTLTLQLSELLAASRHADSAYHKTAAAPSDFHTTQLPSEVETLQKMREHFGITNIQLQPLSELRQSLARHGIRAEENEFSRALLEEREK